MVLTSSPLQYPTTSSPRQEASPRKRRRLDLGQDREPLQDIEDNIRRPEQQTTFGGFIDEDDSEDESPLERLSQEATKPTPGVALLSIDDVESVDSRKELPQDERHDSGCEVTSSPPDVVNVPAENGAATFRSPKLLVTARTASGRTIPVRKRRPAEATHYSALLAARSSTAPGRAQKSYYGIDIHALVDESKAVLESRAQPIPNTEALVAPSIEIGSTTAGPPTRTHLWTEKYRPRKFTDLIGDERTHRSVLRWLKAWDPIVFPSQNPKPKARTSLGRDNANDTPERQHRKILLLTGPAGLGKTTLAHVCARQAGYETQEINASDERTKDVVKGRIRDMVGTENVRTVGSTSNNKKAARPVCVVVDEVDGVVSGSASGGGEGGFIKALLDLLATDYKNATYRPDGAAQGKRKGDNFRMLRPLILICNDVYHPSLRLLRHGPHAEVIHVRKPALQMVVPRLCAIFDREGVPADGDGVRTLCEAAWGVTSKRQGGKGSAGGGQGDGDIRVILVAGEWVAGKLRAAALAGLPGTARLTRRWIEANVVGEMAHGGGMAKSLGRGGARDVVERVFKHNAGFPATLGAASTKRKADEAYGKNTTMGVSEAVKRGTMEKLREMVEASGEDEKILLDCFQTYPTQAYQDTTTLTKPTQASAWLHFSSLCSYRVHHAQEWDLAPYLSFPVLAFHNLFASPSSHNTPSDNNNNSGSEAPAPHPLTTNRADGHAHEITRANTATLTHLQSQLSLRLQRSFRSHARVVTELIPYTLRILNPSVKPVLVGGVSSVRRGEERERVDRAIECMRSVGVRFEKSRIDLRDPDSTDAFSAQAGPPGAPGLGGAGRDNGGWVYRMEPPLDELGTYSLSESKNEGDAGKSRFALRQVLADTCDVVLKTAELEARAKRSGLAIPGLPRNTASTGAKGTKEVEDARKRAKGAVKRDFFGREIVATTASGDAVAADGGEKKTVRSGKGPRVWASYHEGFSNAVRKPFTMKELLEGL